MTREEIISGLQMTMDLIQFDPGTGNVRPIYELNDLDKTTYVACKAAIKALKAQDVPDTNGDTIYRQAAINATWEEPSYTDPMNVLTEVRDRIKALPPAQPEPYREERRTDD